MCCHHIALSILKLSNYLENIPKTIPNKNIKIVFIIFLLVFKVLSGVLILSKIFFILSPILQIPICRFDYIFFCVIMQVEW